MTQYNKFKALCEPLLFKHQDKNFICVTIRPATICGYSPRCRLDLTVNILTNHAFHNNKILVFGGTQKRPNLHVKDMAEAYKIFLEAPDDKIAGEIFNIGYENYLDAATAVVTAEVIPTKNVDEYAFAEKMTQQEKLKYF